MKQLFSILIAGLLVTACNNKSETKEPEPAAKAENKEEEESNITEITEAQMKAVGIETDSLQSKELTTTVKVNGVLTVPNQNKAFVTSVTNGVIRGLFVQPGDFVNRGQLIASIINPDVADIQRELQTTNAQLSLADIEERRQQELVEGNAAPLKNLQRLRTEQATLRATRNALQQQLSAMGISARSVSSGRVNTTINVTAPISGTISNVTSQIGSNVDASTPIAQIVNNSLLHLDIFVYEKDLPQVKDKQTIHFTLTNSPGKEYDAEIFSIGSAFANDTKTIPVHAVVKGDKTGLIDGMNITASISTNSKTVPSVPTEAIVTDAGQDYIFIQVKNEQDHTDTKEQEAAFAFQRFPVTKGASDVGFTEIIPVNPLPAGAKIVTKGAFFVLAKMTNKGEEE